MRLAQDTKKTAHLLLLHISEVGVGDRTVPTKRRQKMKIFFTALLLIELCSLCDAFAKRPIDQAGKVASGVEEGMS